MNLLLFCLYSLSDNVHVTRVIVFTASLFVFLQRKPEIDAAFQGMLLLVTENPRGGLSLHGQDEKEITSKDVSNLDASLAKISATGVNPDFICEVKTLFFSLALYITIGVARMSFQTFHLLIV